MAEVIGWLLGLKAKALWALTGLLGIAAAILRHKQVVAQRDKARARAEIAEAGIRRRAETEEREAEIHSEWSDVERNANEKLDDIPDFLRHRRDK